MILTLLTTWTLPAQRRASEGNFSLDTKFRLYLQRLTHLDAVFMGIMNYFSLACMFSIRINVKNYAIKVKTYYEEQKNQKSCQIWQIENWIISLELSGAKGECNLAFFTNKLLFSKYDLDLSGINKNRKKKSWYITYSILYQFWWLRDIITSLNIVF